MNFRLLLFNLCPLGETHPLFLYHIWGLVRALFYIYQDSYSFIGCSPIPPMTSPAEGSRDYLFHNGLFPNHVILEHHYLATPSYLGLPSPPTPISFFSHNTLRFISYSLWTRIKYAGRKRYLNYFHFIMNQLLVLLNTIKWSNSSFLCLKRICPMS